MYSLLFGMPKMIIIFFLLFETYIVLHLVLKFWLRPCFDAPEFHFFFQMKIWYCACIAITAQKINWAKNSTKISI